MTEFKIEILSEYSWEQYKKQFKIEMDQWNEQRLLQELEINGKVVLCFNDSDQNLIVRDKDDRIIGLGKVFSQNNNQENPS